LHTEKEDCLWALNGGVEKSVADRGLGLHGEEEAARGVVEVADALLVAGRRVLPRQVAVRRRHDVPQDSEPYPRQEKAQHQHEHCVTPPTFYQRCQQILNKVPQLVKHTAGLFLGKNRRGSNLEIVAAAQTGTAQLHIWLT